MELRHYSLDAEQADTLAAVLARLIPADEIGPGAHEAGVIHFLDSEFNGALRGRVPAYQAALRDLDDYTQSLHGKSFATLGPDAQDDVLRAVESGATGSSTLTRWFPLVLDDCLDGFLSDPVHGGNRDFAGWKLVGYPGPSLVWTEEEQELDRPVPFRGSSVVSLTLSRRPAHV